MRIHKAHLPIAVLALISAFIIFPFCGLAADASLKDDAYHYMHNGIDDKLYNEWWYFNGISNDTQFFFDYFISDPENISGMRRIYAVALVLEAGRQPLLGIHSSKGYGGDRNNPLIDIDQNGFNALNESTYRIYGSAADVMSGTPIKWDLIYTAAVPPWFATPVQMHVGHIKGDWMKWLVYMPSAYVKGTISVDNQTRSISAVGYHDHNWGRWAFNDAEWNWAQVSAPDDGFSLTLGDVLGEQRNTMLGITYAGKTARFTGSQIKLSYADFTLDPITARMYPTAYKVLADNGDYRIDMRIDALMGVPITMGYPVPMPTYVIFEQLSMFNGSLKSKEGANYSFNRMGFSEYTTYMLHPIFGKVNTTSNSNITVTATNERTGQVKASQTSSEGYFSFDASYADYLANSTAPWVANGDSVKVQAKDAAGKQSSATVIINMTADRQEIGITEPG
jgi:hypothetical protein